MSQYLTDSQRNQLNQAMNQAGLTKGSDRQAFIDWFLETYTASERGLYSTSDLKAMVQKWREQNGK